MYVCMYVYNTAALYTHTHTHTHIHTYTHTHTDENQYSAFLSQHGGSSNAYTAAENTNYHFQITPEYFMEALGRSYIYICLLAYVYICVYVYVRIHVFMYVCMYTYVYVHTNTYI